jgi:hypothetical protein
VTIPEPSSSPSPSGSENAGTTSELLRLLDAYLDELRAGRMPDRAALIAAHPSLALQLESCLAALDFIHRTERPDPALPPSLGDFHILREIGRGGMGVVYEAEQRSLKRRVALKVLRFGGAADAEAMERFRREAETVAGLHHTNIVPIFAVGYESGVHFFAMQLIAGKSLTAVLEEAKGKTTPLDARTVAGWGVQAAEALAHAHARGVVHRDVKPSNLLLDAEGTVWLTDFGLARRTDEATLTVAGVLLGTPRYMSPEQAAAVQRPVDARGDVYSLGATLYELATGRPVFEAPTAQQLLEQIAAAEPVPPRQVRPELPRDLETVLLKCLAKEPHRRYTAAQELADDLRRVVNGDPVKARRPNLLAQAARWVRRQRVGAWRAALAAVLATLCVVGVFVYALSGDNGPAPEAPTGRLLLRTDGPTLKLERLDESGQPVGAPVNVGPIALAVDMPAGWQRLRLTATGRLPEEQQVLIEDGAERAFTLALAEPLPLNLPDVRDFYFLSSGGYNDLLLNGDAPRLLVDGKTGRELWRNPNGWERVQWPPGGTILPAAYLDGGQRYPRKMVWRGGESPDVVLPDFVLPETADENASWPGTPNLIAISGKDGAVLWRAGDPGASFPPLRVAPERARPFVQASVLVGVLSAGPLCCLTPLHAVGHQTSWHLHKRGHHLQLRARILGTPRFADVDGDGRPDVVAVFEATEHLQNSEVLLPEQPGEWPTGRRAMNPGWPGWKDLNCVWVEAFAGLTGRSLWRCPVLQDHKDTLPPWADDVQPATLLASVAGRPVLVLYARSHLTAVDVRTGKPLWKAPAVFDLKHARLSIAADFQGGGRAAVVAIGDSANRQNRDQQHSGYHAHWLDTGEPLPLPAGSVPEEDETRGFSELEVQILPDGRPFHTYKKPLGEGGEVEVGPDGVSRIVTDIRAVAYDAPGGAPLWRTDLRKLGKVMFGYGGWNDWVGTRAGVRRTLGPVPGDGPPDVFTAALIERRASWTMDFVGYQVAPNLDPNRPPFNLFLAINAGNDGRTLARRLAPVPVSTPRPKDGLGAFQRLVVWPTGEPRLAFDLHNPSWRSWHTYLWSPLKGRVDELGANLAVETVLDLDGDGIPELVTRSTDPVPGEPDKVKLGLRIFRGTPPYQWRRVGAWRSRLALIDDEGKGQWDCGPYPTLRGLLPYVAPPLPHGDLDGDGVPDVLFFRILPDGMSSTLTACSGADGRRLWSVSFPAVRDKNTGLLQPTFGRCWFLGCHRLTKDGPPCVLAAGGDSSPHFLLILDGATGEVRRRFDGPEVKEWVRCRPAFADVNGDGMLEILGYRRDENRLEPDRDRDWFHIGLDVKTGRVFHTLEEVQAVGSVKPWLEPEQPEADLVRDAAGGVTTLLRPRQAGPDRAFRDVTAEEEDQPRVWLCPWVAPGRASLREAAGVAGLWVAVLFACALARRWGMVVGLPLCLLAPPLLALHVLPQKDGQNLFPAEAFPSDRGAAFSWQEWYLVWPYVLTRGGGLGEGVILNPVVWMGCWVVAAAVQVWLRRHGKRLPGLGWLVLGLLAGLVLTAGPTPSWISVFAYGVVGISILVPLLLREVAVEPKRGQKA